MPDGSILFLVERYLLNFSQIRYIGIMNQSQQLFIFAVMNKITHLSSAP